MENILIIGLVPYGYNTDWYKFSENLSKKYNVYYLCRKDSQREYVSEQVKVIRFEATNKSYYLKTFLEAKKLRDKLDFKRVFVYVYPFCSLLRLLFSKEQLIMDIRTSYISSPFKTWICNKLIKIESLAFGTISVISFGVADFLRLNKNKCRLLPLGGEALPFVLKNMDSIRLFYVGTFYDRNIYKTVEGFSIFKKNNPDADVTYTIAGVGSKLDVDQIKNAIINYGLEDTVIFVGEKRGEELIELFNSHNVGVSYIPLTDYYDCQPPTKTFEYLLSTMLVIATPTTENSKVIDYKNGNLSLSDAPEDFAKSVAAIYSNKQNFDLKDIRIKAEIYSWVNVVEIYLLPLC